MNNEKELRKEFEIWYLNNKNQGLNDIADWWIEKMANQLQETSLDQYAMGQSEGMDYHEFKMKELWDKCEEAKQILSQPMCKDCFGMTSGNCGKHSLFSGSR